MNQSPAVFEFPFRHAFGEYVINGIGLGGALSVSAMLAVSLIAEGHYARLVFVPLAALVFVPFIMVNSKLVRLEIYADKLLLTRRVGIFFRRTTAIAHKPNLNISIGEMSIIHRVRYQEVPYYQIYVQQFFAKRFIFAAQKGQVGKVRRALEKWLHGAYSP